MDYSDAHATRARVLRAETPTGHAPFTRRIDARTGVDSPLVHGATSYPSPARSRQRRKRTRASRTPSPTPIDARVDPRNPSAPAPPHRTPPDPSPDIALRNTGCSGRHASQSLSLVIQMDYRHETIVDDMPRIYKHAILGRLAVLSRSTPDCICVHPYMHIYIYIYIYIHIYIYIYIYISWHVKKGLHRINTIQYI